MSQKTEHASAKRLNKTPANKPSAASLQPGRYIPDCKRLDTVIPSRCSRKVFASKVIGEPQSEQEDVQVQYEKVTSAKFSVDFGSVAIRNGEHKSFMLLWKIPGYSLGQNKDQGFACQLGRTEYEIHNVCDYVITFRLQRPLGYKENPSSLAMWEPHLKGEGVNAHLIEVTPGKVYKFTMGNHSNNLTEARELNVGGQPYAHLLSFSCYREVTGTHGENLTPKGAAFDFKMSTYHRVNDGSIGAQVDDHIVRAFSTANHMNYVSNGPTVPVKIGDLAISEGKYGDYIRFEEKESVDPSFKVMKCNLYDSKGAVLPNLSSLDTKTVYRMPAAIPITNVDYRGPGAMFDCLVYNEQHGWSAGTYIVDDAKKIIPKSIYYVWSKVQTPIMFSSEYLYPLNSLVKSNVITRKRYVKAMTMTVNERVLSESLTGPVDTAVKAVVEVLKVMRLVVQGAVAFGLMTDQLIMAPNESED